MELRALTFKEDRQNELFQSEEARQLLEMYDQFYHKVGYHFPWVGYLIVGDDKVLGSCGFTGKPVNSQVEIAYWTFKENEGRGIASFACRELLSIAKKEDASLIITAKTAPQHNASTHILEKNGFEYRRVVQDEEIGDAWLWVCKKQ